MNAARESAKQAISGVGFVGAPVQSMTSAVSGADGLIVAVDWMSSFLKTLEKFNAVADNIAMVSIMLCLRVRLSSFHVQVHPYAQAALTILSSFSKVWSLRSAGLTQSNLRVAGDH